MTTTTATTTKTMLRRTTRSSASTTKKKMASAVVSKKKPTTATEHLEWRGHRITAFEKRVYELISTIPAGRVSTYGDVARALASGPRPVGQALRKNPFAPEVPCHRVVAASLEIGGFKGSFGDESAHICEKRQLLRDEGVTFTKDNKIDATCVHSF